MESNLQFRRPLFWEINEHDIKKVLEESYDWVIVRVFEYGSIDDIFDVIELYGEPKLREVLTEETLQPMGAAMAFLFLDIDVKERYAA